ncbi:MAG: helix-turn-helix transcriptional regulator [Oscillospiraceae bacterium]|jgi:transcriptional regulator with XRE-family HTH domain|nr:helix-turn-helix transcriptional regulator [Oscillospiraceae bacterium]
MGNKIHDVSFVRRRIAELRKEKGVTEHKMSLELGKHKSYIQHIMAGRALPSLTQLYAICDYFEVSMQDFFKVKLEHPKLTNRVMETLYELGDDELELVINLIKMLDSKSKT